MSVSHEHSDELPTHETQKEHQRKPELSFVAIALGLVMGAAGGGIAGLIMNSTIEFFAVQEPPETANTQGILTPEQMALVQAAHRQADLRNFPLNTALLACVVCGLLGIVPGLVNKNPSATVKGLSVGAISGIVFGAVGGLLAIVVREQLRGWDLLTASGQHDPLKLQAHTMALQLPAWAGVAVALGLAFAAGSGNRRLFGPVAGSALAGWMLAALLYPATSSLLFSGDHSDMIIPSGFGNRIFWSTMTACLVGLMAGRNCEAKTS